MKKTKLTSIKILDGLYQDFKIAIVNSPMTFQKLANRAIHLYLKDNDFREILDASDTLKIVSGSRF